MNTYKRVLLKLSGEVLMGNQPFGIHQEACLQLAQDLARIHRAGIELGLVIGGGNIFRGINLKSSGLPRTPADQMGMLATMLNGIALQQALKSLGLSVSLMSALECPKIAESYNWQRALHNLNEGTIVIFVGGTGNPYFTTDTAAALRAIEMGADLLLKATKVNGIYDKDPLKYPNAIQYQTLTYTQMLKEKLQVMDATAVELCESNGMPLFVFNMNRLSGTLEEILAHGTWVQKA